MHNLIEYQQLYVLTIIDKVNKLEKIINEKITEIIKQISKDNQNKIVIKTYNSKQIQMIPDIQIIS